MAIGKHTEPSLAYVPNPDRPLYRMCYLCSVLEGPDIPLEPLPDRMDLLACPKCTALNQNKETGTK